jgi:hypothetical protein
VIKTQERTYSYQGAAKRINPERKEEFDRLMAAVRLHMEVNYAYRKNTRVVDMGGSSRGIDRGEDCDSPSTLESLSFGESSITFSNVVGEESRGNPTTPKPVSRVSKGKKSRISTPA